MQDPSSPTLARNTWWFMVVAALIMMITMGSRQSMGLFISPLNTSTGLGIVNISLALAIGQFAVIHRRDAAGQPSQLGAGAAQRRGRHGSGTGCGLRHAANIVHMHALTQRAWPCKREGSLSAGATVSPDAAAGDKRLQQGRARQMRANP